MSTGSATPATAPSGTIASQEIGRLPLKGGSGKKWQFKITGEGVTQLLIAIGGQCFSHAATKKVD